MIPFIREVQTGKSMIGETKYETKYDWWLSRPGVGGGCWGKWGDCKWVREGVENVLQLW